jgi:hypothetical protein
MSTPEHDTDIEPRDVIPELRDETVCDFCRENEGSAVAEIVLSHGGETHICAPCLLRCTYEMYADDEKIPPKVVGNVYFRGLYLNRGAWDPEMPDDDVTFEKVPDKEKHLHSDGGDDEGY